MYFYAEREAASTAFAGEVAWELGRATGGTTMWGESASPAGAPLSSASLGPASFETNRIYQSGLLDAEDRWLWKNLLSGSTKTKAFDLAGVDATSAQPARLSVLLQGGSDAEGVVDHHVRVSVNGVFVGEAVFDAKRPHRFGAAFASSILLEGANQLSVENVGDTGVYSLVFLDHFTIDYPQTSTLRGGRFEGVWDTSGVAEISGVSGGGPSARGAAVEGSAGAGSRDRTGRRGRAPGEARAARTLLPSLPSVSALDIIAPAAFLDAAGPLLLRRQAQGLKTRAVSLEEIASAFGGGDPSAEAIRAFLAHAYHSWRPPSPRYVLLLGDASHDPRNFTGTAAPAPLPGMFLKTTYLWTVSDPALAAVNGDDLLPDLAIGRRPAQTADQVQTLVDKLLAWEDSGQGLSGEAVLVADNPDDAGDFEADVQDIASSFLGGRNRRMLFLSQLGAASRRAILDALDDGVSTLSYVGHGGAAVWASENVLNSWDVPSLQPQSTRPLMLTLNCLNGYFVAPSFESLAEAFLKAEGRGTIAAFSPSGLSVDGPAHQFHRALMAELTLGNHQRLGDAILAAQKAYAETGLMPELLSIYQLLGDPAMIVR